MRGFVRFEPNETYSRSQITLKASEIEAFRNYNGGLYCRIKMRSGEAYRVTCSAWEIETRIRLAMLPSQQVQSGKKGK